MSSTVLSTVCRSKCPCSIAKKKVINNKDWATMYESTYKDKDLE